MIARQLAALLKDTDAARPAAILDNSMLDAACVHGIGPLLYRALHDRRLLDDLPPAIGTALTQMAREEALLEPFRRGEVARIIETLDAAGVQPLIFKGTALAYTCYPEAWLRPRFDTDLLIRSDDVGAASRVFERLGCTRTVRPAGEHVSHQFTYVQTRSGIQTAFDVHWKIADPQAFADLFSYAELERDAVALPALGACARALSDVHALLVACMHRVAHHYDHDTLILVHDIDLLARRLDPSDWDRLVLTAADKRIRAVTMRGLDLASELLGTTVPPAVRSALAPSAEAEPTAAYLDHRLRKVDILWSDLGALGGWRSRLKLLREHLLPPPTFILRSYGQTRPVLLPVLYVHRIFRGAGKWFRPLR